MMKPRPLTHYAMLSVVAAVLTFLLKMGAWKLTGSVSLLSDALESLANLAAALIALASLAVAIQPEDEDHAFGHSKAEYFAAGIEGALVLLAAFAIGWTAVERFFSPHVLTQPFAGVTISVLASVVNLVVARLLLKIGRARRSVALEADAQHLMTDVWTSAAVVVAVIVIAFTNWWWLDPLLGLLLAVQIVVVGIKLIRDSMHGLMDSALPAAELEIMRLILTRYADEGIHYHALRTRQAAALKFASVHLLMPGAWTIAHGHDVAERLEAELRAALTGLVVITHLEPIEDPVSWEDEPLERKSPAAKPVSSNLPNTEFPPS